MNNTKNYLLGILIPFLIALTVRGIASLGFHFISSSVLALFIGLLISYLLKDKRCLHLGLTFTSKHLLKVAIILLGFTLNIMQLVKIGKYSLFVMLFTLFAGYGSGYLLGKIFKIDWKLSSLIASGTCICGGSAIAAISPIIEADDNQVAYALSATFIFDMLMIVLFPIMGHYLNLSDLSFGLWAGTAVNDTSSVVATGYAYSQLAGDYATIVKLTRTTSIVPIALIFTFISNKAKRKTNPSTVKTTYSIRNVFPYFIILFVIAAVINTFGLIPSTLIPYISTISKFLMAMALAAIGLKTDLKKMFSAGFSPMILGFLVSLIVVVVSISVQFLLGQL